MKINRKIIFLLFSSAMFFSGFCFSFADTEIHGDTITEDTTWTKDNSPYLVYESPSVEDGAVLNIQAGVTVEFDSGQEIDVWGKVDAKGTGIEKVILTNFSDVQPKWEGIKIFDGGEVDLKNSDIENANTGLDFYGGKAILESSAITGCGQGINNFFGSVSLIDSLMQGNDDNLFSYAGENHVESSTVNYSGYGVISGFGSTLSILNSTLENTGNSYSGSAIEIFTNGSSTIRGSKIIKPYIGIEIWDNSTLNLSDSEIDNTYGSGALNIYNDSIATVTNLFIDGASGNGDGVINIFNHGVLNASNLDIEDASGYGLSIQGTQSYYATSTLDISSSTISGFGSAGIIDYGKVNINANEVSVKNFSWAAIATFDSGGFYPVIKLEKSLITNNSTGIFSRDTYLNINNSSIFDNTSMGLLNANDDGRFTIDVKNNWWGDKSGPYNETMNASGTGNIILNQVDFIPWLKYDPLISRKTPVLFVPGVLGTEIIKPTNTGEEKMWLDLLHNLTDIGDQFMDPLVLTDNFTSTDDSLVLGDVIRKETVDTVINNIVIFDYFDGLSQEFQSQGYVAGVNLFVFPYDWRFGVSLENIDKLKQKISEILDETGSDKIDIIAHSTGGLLVKKYAIDNPADNHIAKTIFVGVPNTGAPQAIKALVVGDDEGIPFLSTTEMKKLAKNFPVVYDLSPSKQYFDRKGSYVEIMNQNHSTTTTENLNFDETNSFLIGDHSLNSLALENSHDLHTKDFDDFDLRTLGIDLYSINGCKTGTFGKLIEMRNSSLLDRIYTSYNSPLEVPGDGSVPLESSTNLPINSENRFFALRADHGKMPSQDGVRQEIVNIISGSSLQTPNITGDISKCVLNGRAIAIYSPLSIDVYDQDGNHSGLTSDGTSTENNIPNADFQIMDGHKFVYIPTDEGQIYDIKINGTATGTFTITDSDIVDNKIVRTQVFKNISITPEQSGLINIGATTTVTLNENIIFPSLFLNGEESSNFNPQAQIEEEKVAFKPVISIFGDRPRLDFDKIEQNQPEIMSEIQQSAEYTTSTTEITKENLNRKDTKEKIVYNEAKNIVLQTQKGEDIQTKQVSNDNLTATVLQPEQKFGLWFIIKTFIKKLFHIK